MQVCLGRMTFGNVIYGISKNGAFRNATTFSNSSNRFYKNRRSMKNLTGNYIIFIVNILVYLRRISKRFQQSGSMENQIKIDIENQKNYLKVMAKVYEVHLKRNNTIEKRTKL